MLPVTVHLDTSTFWWTCICSHYTRRTAFTTIFILVAPFRIFFFFFKDSGPPQFLPSSPPRLFSNPMAHSFGGSVFLQGLAIFFLVLVFYPPPPVASLLSLCAVFQRVRASFVPVVVGVGGEPI